jgi:V8-like Glu-specific endopeptidase
MSANAKVIGFDERRLPAATTFTEIERIRYSGIARIECPSKWGKLAFGTGVHVRNFRTMVTAAHVFRDPRDGSRLDPTTCNAVFYNPEGSIREAVAIEKVQSRWDNPFWNEDPSNDIAYIRLSKETYTPEQIASLRYGEEIVGKYEVTLVGFHSDMPNSIQKKTLRKSRGIAVRAPANSFHILFAAKNKTPLKNPENLIVSDYDSQHGTSGSPIFNSLGKIIGINHGATDDIAGIFNPQTSYNLGIILAIIYFT